MFNDKFDNALATFVEGAQAIAKASSHAPEKVNLFVQPLKKYVRVVRQSYGQNSVHCFVDIATGDVLKADSWKRPAKHARGNIFDEHNGLNGVSPYGGKYLR